MEKVAFYTLGCKLNFSETSTIARLFENEGFQKVNFEEGADIYVINTCSVTDNADKKCRRIVQEARRFAGNPYIIVMGCYAQLKPAEISAIPGVDAVLGAAEKFRLFEYLKDFVKKPAAVIHSAGIEEASDFHHAFSLMTVQEPFLKFRMDVTIPVLSAQYPSQEEQAEVTPLKISFSMLPALLTVG
jgi:threonylcarbamoyladenosine tRNA methylthiotransferase MtaB